MKRERFWNAIGVILMCVILGCSFWAAIIFGGFLLPYICGIISLMFIIAMRDLWNEKG
jgi:hypothetical protein